MPRRKQARRTNVKDMRSILRLTYDQGQSVRAVSERLKLSKTTVSTYVLRAREAGLASWPLPPGYEDDAALERLLFRRVGRPPQDLTEPDWPLIVREIKRKGVTLTLLWQEYRAANEGRRTWGLTQFCEHYKAYTKTLRRSMRQQHRAGEKLFVDYAGPTPPCVRLLVARIGTDNSGARMKDERGEIRTSIQGPGGGQTAAAGERIGG